MTEKQDSPLIEACREQPLNKEMIFKLISQKVNLNETDKFGSTALIILSAHLVGLYVGFKQMEYGEQMDEIISMIKDYENVIMELITSDCDINIRNQHDYSAMYYICSAQNTKLANKMIDMEVDLDFVNQLSQSPVRIACVHYTWHDGYNEFEPVIIRLLEKTNLIELEMKDQHDLTILDCIHRYKSSTILNHIKLLYRNCILECIANETVVSRCYRNPNADLNII